MTEQLLSTTAERAELLFNFPSDALRPGLQKFDWTEVASVPMRYASRMRPVSPPV